MPLHVEPMYITDHGFYFSMFVIMFNGVGNQEVSRNRYVECSFCRYSAL